jgi:nitroreductase
MKRKPFLAIIVMLLLTTLIVKSQSSDNNVVELILSSYSAKTFSTQPVTDIEIEQIVKCGMKAPSARNKQPWFFTVVRDTSLLNKIFPNLVAGNALIVVSGPNDTQSRTSVVFDCGLALQSMYIAAQGLGLGAHIYGRPVSVINESMLSILEIPEGYSAISVLRIGNLDQSVDGFSSASPRNQLEDIVNYK